MSTGPQHNAIVAARRRVAETRDALSDAKAAALAAYNARSDASEAYKQAREALAYALAFPEGAPKPGDAWPAWTPAGGPTYPPGEVVALALRGDWVAIHVETPVGRYVARRQVPREKDARP